MSAHAPTTRPRRTPAVLALVLLGPLASALPARAESSPTQPTPTQRAGLGLVVHATLVGRGLRRILCEGGPTLFADLAHSGNVSELCLSIAPLHVGPGAGRISSGPEWPDDPRDLELTGALEEDGALFLRYQYLGQVENGSTPPSP